MDNLKPAMAFGSVTELNKLDRAIDKDLLVRLYKVPIVTATCFVETHGVCQNEYLVSVSSFDEYPEKNVFKLKTVGDIDKIHWPKEDKIDSVEIELTVNKYTKEAMLNKPALKNTQTNVKLILDLNVIIETME